MKNWLYIAILLSWVSCTTRQEFGPQHEYSNSTSIDSLLSGTIVLNEGNFGYENASLSVISVENSDIENSVYKRVNGQSLGDVAQSCLVVDSLLVVVVNNSNQIKILHLNSWKELASITIDAAPRYAQRVNEQVLITTMGTAGIKRLDIGNKSVANWAQSSGWQEELIQYKQELYVCNRDKHQVDVYDVQGGNLIRSYSIGRDPESVVEKNGFIWVLTTGGWDVNKREQAKLVRINPISSRSDVVYTFPNIEDSPTRLRKSVQENKLYFINNGIWKFDLNESMLKPRQIPTVHDGIWYGLNVHPVDGSIYATNAADYVSSGSVYHFSKDEKLLNTYQAGVIPSFVAFY